MDMSIKGMVLSTLSNDAFVLVNKKVSKAIGFVEAGLLAELIFEYKKFEQTEDFFECGNGRKWFYLTQKDVEDRLGIKRREHENAIKKLISFSLIATKKLGLPAKTYYIINWDKIGEILSGNTPKPAPLSDCTKRTNKDGRNVQTRMDETYKQDWTKEPSIHIYKKDLDLDLKDLDLEDLNKDLNLNLNQITPNTEIRSVEQPETQKPTKNIHDLDLPEKVKRLIYDYDLFGYGNGQGLYNSLDPLEIERFYNTSPYIKPKASKDDSNYVNEFDFYNIVNSIITKGPRPVQNSIGLLKRYALNKLSFKVDNENYQRDVEGFSNGYEE